jgi:hypothetical protein
MKRDLIDEIGTSPSPDVTIEIDVEATLTTMSAQPPATQSSNAATSHLDWLTQSAKRP